ncbi:MAG: DUF3362 domain-containing protein, partial [Erysipelotrichales bacterium]|nr:DUF3362 domain-containing protein [Erysipelotrichales bacterium]
YYTGIDPMTMEEVYVARDPEEKAMQRALMQFTYPQNYDKVYKALQKAGRLDLVGYGEECLIKPRKSGTHHDRVRSNHTRRGEKKR